MPSLKGSSEETHAIRSCKLVQAGSTTPLGKGEASAESRRKEDSPGTEWSRSRGGHSSRKEKQEQRHGGTKVNREQVLKGMIGKGPSKVFWRVVML